MLRWKIYYSDGSVFSDLEGGPEEAPGYGVICIKQLEPTVGWILIRNSQHYYWKDDQWMADGFYDAFTTGLTLYLCGPRRGWKCVMAGENRATAVYDAIIKSAINEEGWPPKSAFLANEPRV